MRNKASQEPARQSNRTDAFLSLAIMAGLAFIVGRAFLLSLPY
ncbi:TPA: hypothetical protein ACNHQ5_004357 [Escherichia coli]|jgi:hypothetical protein